MVKSVISATQSPFPINLAAMTDHVNHDKLLVVKHLIKDTVVADTKLVQSCKTARHRFRVNIVQILSQPIDTLNDTPANWSSPASSRVAASRIWTRYMPVN